jgi:hypothetical protein
VYFNWPASERGRNRENEASMDLERALMREAVAQIKKDFHEKVGSIRHPETGEFPTVIVRGDTLDDLSVQVEGSPELLALVKDRLGVEADGVSFEEAASARPKVFLSYTTADQALAKQIAEALMAQGIETWWDQWEIRAGDSLRQKIDEGLGNCTHFVVLLTDTSIKKPWVNAELDAALVRKLNNQCRLIPLRHGIEPSSLPPLLQGLRSPTISAGAGDIQQIINDIHGITDKPPLGQAPNAVTSSASTGYSAAASAVARVFVEASEHGDSFDPQFSVAELREKTGLTNEDMDDAFHELRDLAKERFGSVRPERYLFAEFDQHWKPWNPSEDALVLAAAMVNSPDFPAAMSAIAERLHWSARRLNPAASYLMRRQLVEYIDSLDSRPFTAHRITRNDATRRFVKSRQIG